MNKNTIEGKWAEIKGEIRKAWGTVTGDELESAKGSLKSLLGTIQRRVGHTEDDVKQKFNAILNKFGVHTDETGESSDEGFTKSSEKNPAWDSPKNFERNRRSV